MPTESQAKIDADILLVHAQTEKLRAELAAINAERQSKNPKFGGFLIESIKVIGALILGAGGVIAAFSGYQLSEVKKERYELDARKALEEANRTKLEVATLNSERNKAQESFNAISSQLAATQTEFTRLNASLSELKNQSVRGQKSVALESAIASAQQLETRVGAAGDSARNVQQGLRENLYYVISMTSGNRKDMDTEIDRVKTKVGARFKQEFPDLEVYQPQGGLHTLLVSKSALRYDQAIQLKQRAIDAGFSKDTWLWQSGVPYFSEKNR